MKHLFVSMSVKQNFFVSVFVHKCLMVMNDVEYTTFKMFVMQMSNYLFVISFQLMFYKTLYCSSARPLVTCIGPWNLSAAVQPKLRDILLHFNLIFLFKSTESVPWIPEAPSKTEKRDFWFHDDKASF